MESLSKELFIDLRQSELVIALTENKQLVELYRVHHQKSFSVGDIYLGRVKKIVTGLNATFVEIGSEKDAFLHYLDLGPQFATLKKFLDQLTIGNGRSLPWPVVQEPDIDKAGKINQVLQTGQQIIVQIAKEPIGQKGPRLSSEISLAGRNLVLVPFSDRVSISSKIRSIEEKNRLKRIFSSIRPPGYGLIIRTNAQNRSVDKLDAELRQLVEKWENAFSALSDFQAPKLLISEINRTSAIIRDLLNDSFSQIIANDQAIYQEIKQFIDTFAPEKKSILKLYSGRSPLLDQFGIDRQMKSLFGKTVTFKNGAYIIIEHTEALHVIDVNSGNRTRNTSDQESNALEINLAAATEIARQLRLRDMGGIIVIDFIDMHDPQNRAKLFEEMKALMAGDKAKHTILPLTKFGLMQITRQRVRPETIVETTEKCPSCLGSGTITAPILLVDEIARTLRFHHQRSKFIWGTLEVHPFVYAFLKQGFPSPRLRWIWSFKAWINVKPNHQFSFLEYQFTFAKSDGPQSANDEQAEE